jgi:PTH2 family peptidyl-tRNA hydrolase
MKQVIVVRSDLKLGKGKLAAHVSHASLAGYKLVKEMEPSFVEEWEREGEKKIVVKVENERELFELYEKIKKEIPCVIIKDAGFTQIPPGTVTCLVVGPWKDEEVDKFTKDLKLL